MDFDHWLGTTLDLQRGSFGVDPHGLFGDELMDYIVWNTLAAHTELSEFLREVAWKPWALDRGEWVNREEAVTELVDVLHFIANLMVALKVDGRELTERYTGKQQVNRDRQDEGYVSERLF